MCPETRIQERKQRDYNGPTLINVIGVHPCVINSVLLTLENSLTYIKLEMDVHTHLNKLKKRTRTTLYNSLAKIINKLFLCVSRIAEDCAGFLSLIL